MYTQGIYNAFLQLRKQYYKLKTRDSLDRYDKIEYHKKSYKTFQRFCDRIDEWNCNMIRHDYESGYGVQEQFERMIELSNNNTLKYYIQ